jgi:DNA modification methylase
VAHKKILVFSYYTNVPGVCQAEWVDDRIFAFIEKGYSISLVSCTYCHTHTSSKIKHYKTPALSPHGAAYEYTEIREKKIPHNKGLSYFYTWMMYLINKVLYKLNIHSGEGRWSWFVSAFFSSLLYVQKKKDLDFIYSTGGPPSAHLSAILIGRLYGKKVISEFGQRHNVWEINTSGQENMGKAIEHPATFPEKLANDHILSWSNEGDIVLDCFLGSGTTGKIAKQLNRRFVGIEISPEYLKIASKRIYG